MALYRAKTIKQMWECEKVYHPKLKEWIPSRPHGFKMDSIRKRMKWAWGVLVGRYDAVDWQDVDIQQNYKRRANDKK